ncbi:ParA family protein [Ktedonospora formicarum]|uniref:Chromosome partitioning protein ParA n=1 Tax=Ktedonospora formicarum TaxID=2778364 RepID=A0A8J3ICH2_9CHLR|nr:ParA family protein [Ktedonospora formicarum]GHO51443.1 chromosome partitioning protein ParA [Ktedonospora formicarum]
MSDARTMFVGSGKGGTGKTTTAQNLASAFVAAGYRVLGVDGDGQASWSHLNGLFPRQGRPNIYSALKQLIEQYETKVGIYHLPSGLDFIPSSSGLHKIVSDLASVERSEYLLQQLLTPLKGRYDLIIIDCPPALNAWTNNIFMACDDGIITIQLEPLGIASAGETLEYLQGLRKRGLFMHHDLKLSGGLITMMDSRTAIHRNLAEVAQEQLGQHMSIFSTRIERTIQFPEAQYFGLPIDLYNKDSKGTAAYAALAEEVLAGTSLRSVSGLQVPARFADSLLQAASSIEEQAGENGTEVTWEEIDVVI